ncbi:formimidoylglutamate deiminase [Mangrovimonas sp. TPBH4]|uniref:formimidoylglutamate deiminase n=1 Tax=Mangrovimonas sp. TPBH4 TaxID=1645914 RepID=UPI0006B66FBB|nr:formimidoylglutamate deiminase [Mangrovimonas sp. TPBH4]
MPTYIFKGLLTNDGWLENAAVTVDDQGIIESISSEATAEGENVNGYALPGFQNAHSHAFQYAMAGLAELHEGTGVPDDFWSWRTAMYNLALSMSPQHLEDIAAMLYAEMVRHGYTAVAEFHYLHHDINGMPYSNLAEHGERLIAAAERAGINITLVPMFYQKGGFGTPAEDKQKRFISPTIEDYYKLLESSNQATKTYKNASLGIGIHSLRAVDPNDIISVGKNYNNDLPFHIHVSEQLKEIEDCMAFHGKRPVEWLLDNCSMTENFHLVHATHLNDHEVAGIAQTKANVVLCPSTEGNLGDGLFRFNDFKNLNGQWSIGTDSHVGLNPFEELRILDYGQRLTTHKRNTYFQPNAGDSGFNAIEMAWKAGKRAMGEHLDNFFKVGQSFDAVVMDVKSPLVATASTKHLCNTFVYTTDASNILGTIINGKWVAKQGIHNNLEAISSRFVNTMKELGSRI